MNETLHRSPAEIEQDIHATRASIDDTLARLQRKLSPANLAGQALDFARDNGSAVASNAATMMGNAGRAVRDNPVPFALMCLGAVWLMAGPRIGHTVGAERPPARPRDPNRGRLQSGGYPGAIVHQESHSAGNGAGAKRPDGGGPSVSAATREQAARLGDAVKGAGVAMAEGAASAADHMTGQARRTRDGVTGAARAAGEYAQTHPFVAGAALLAVGAAIAAFLPRTRAEDGWLGAASDRTKAAARQTASDVADAAGEATSAAAEEFKAEADRQGLTPERAKRESADIAAGAGEAARAAMRAAKEKIAEHAAARNAETRRDEARPEGTAGTAATPSGAAQTPGSGDRH